MDNQTIKLITLITIIIVTLFTRLIYFTIESIILKNKYSSITNPDKRKDRYKDE